MPTIYPFNPPVPASNSQVPSVITGVNPWSLNPIPSAPINTPFSFSPTLDGNQYNVTVPWCLFGQRFYVQCSTLSNSLVFYLPLIGSQDSIPLQGISWVPNTVTATTKIPHGYQVGSVANISIRGTSPDAYNGTYLCSIISSTQFSYTLTSDPGAVSVLGAVSYDINIAGGYFSQSSLIYRTNNSQFEVYP